MKTRYFIPLCAAILLGFLVGKIITNNRDNSISVFYEGESIYFITTGVYDEKEEHHFEGSIYQLEDDGFHEYVGITNNKETAERIKEYYKKLGNNCSVSEKRIANKEYINVLNEYDKVLLIANDLDLINIEKIVLANYEEMVLQSYEN